MSARTKRRYLAAVQSFAAYLLELGVLGNNRFGMYRPRPPPIPAAFSWSFPTCSGS